MFSFPLLGIFQPHLPLTRQWNVKKHKNEPWWSIAWHYKWMFFIFMWPDNFWWGFFFFFKNGFYGNYILYSFFDTFIKGSSFCHLILSLHLTLCPSIWPFLIHSIFSSKSSCPVYEHKRNSNINTTNQNYEYDGKFVSVLLRAEYLNYKKYFSKRAHQWHY